MLLRYRDLCEFDSALVHLLVGHLRSKVRGSQKGGCSMKAPENNVDRLSRRVVIVYLFILLSPYQIASGIDTLHLDGRLPQNREKRENVSTLSDVAHSEVNGRTTLFQGQCQGRQVDL